MQSEAAAKLELWFFRDMLESNRLRLFELFGFKPSEMDTMAKQQMVFRRILDALSTEAEPVKTAPAVAVKALEWREDWGGSEDDIVEWVADTPWGRVFASVAGYREATGRSYERHADVPDELRIELQSATEAHHQARILSALSAQVQDVAVQDVIDELRRQVEVEGWSAVHDDTHDKGEMAGAAACYALAGVTYVAPDHYPPRKRYAAVVDARNSIPERDRETTREAIKLALGEPSAPKNWPWHASWWKPTDTRRNIVKAAALLISEIKRIDRAAAPDAKQATP